VSKEDLSLNDVNASVTTTDASCVELALLAATLWRDANVLAIPEEVDLVRPAFAELHRHLTGTTVSSIRRGRGVVLGVTRYEM
jgi:hypothetical protein